MFTSVKSRVAGGAALVAAMAVALGVTIAPATDDETNADQMRIGTYDPEMVFQQYHGFAELMQVSQRLQQQFQEAQMAGDQQRIMELQQELQQAQMRIINQFQADVERVVPEIAQEQDLKVVAVQIVYTADEYDEPEDITQEIAEKLAEEAPESTPTEPADPFGPAPGQPGDS